MKTVKKAVAKAAVARKKAAAKKKAAVVRKTAVMRPKINAAATAREDAKNAPQSVFQEEYTIEARSFGPIAEAKLTLKPLTVLIGPSNTGKTYMATLACMMMKKHADFTRGIREKMWISHYEPLLEKMSEDELKKFTLDLSIAVKKAGHFIFLSDMPDKVKTFWHSIAKSAFSNHWDGVESDIKDYYGISNMANLVASGGHGPFMCEYKALKRDSEMVNVRVDMSKKHKIISTSSFRDMHFPIFSQQIIQNLDRMKQADALSMPRRHNLIMAFRVINGILRESVGNPAVHFLPASRGGLLQAQRIMSMAMMRIGSRAGLAEIPTIPTLSRTSVDFLEDINYRLDALSAKSNGKSLTTQSRSKILWAPEFARLPTNLRKIAEDVTNVLKKTEELLEGEIIAKMSRGSGKSPFLTAPTMGYRPNHPIGVNAILEMAESSSMVSEVAPLVLYLRGGIGLGDTLFIEEPEAHLHPAAQTTMAEILAAMVRAGIRVIITTHSDWLLDAIANLVRQGESEVGNGATTLKADDVGVWLFKRDKKHKGTTAVSVPFDNNGGYIPESLSDFFIAHHNQSAGLQAIYDRLHRQKTKKRKA